MQPYTLKLAKTLWQNTYRGFVSDQTSTHIATLTIIPQIPLDRTEIPENAPQAPPCVLVLVEDAPITPENVLDFETNLSSLILSKVTTALFTPEYCHFTYPSPAFMLQA